MPFSLAPIQPLVARAAGGKPNARRTSRRAALRCRAEGVGNNDDASDSVAQITGDWRQFRAALVSQEHAHRLSGQSNHVVSAFDRRRRSNKQMSPSDWAHRLPEAETGCLLLAPETEEGWWRHSVVLVLNHDNQGSTGVILNRPTNAHLHQVVPEIDYDAPHHKVLANRQVSMGGPMGTEKGSRCLVALSHRPLQGATSEVFPGLWHVSDFSAVRPEHEPFLSVFVGYCGWMEGQLNAEVAADGWTVAAASASNTLGLVNNPKAGDLMGESMWASMRQRLGLAPSV